MKSNVYDVTLYWHDGGSLFLGAVAASSAGAAQDDALRHYVAQSGEQKREIEEGGNYQIEAELLPPDDAADWRLKRKK